MEEQSHLYWVTQTALILCCEIKHFHGLNWTRSRCIPSFTDYSLTLVCYHSPYCRKSWWGLQGIWCSEMEESHPLQDMFLWHPHLLYFQLENKGEKRLKQIKLKWRTKLQISFGGGGGDLVIRRTSVHAGPVWCIGQHESALSLLSHSDAVSWSGWLSSKRRKILIGQKSTY